MLDKVATIVESALSVDNAVAASTALHAAMTPLGISYFQSRLYRRPARLLTSQAHWQAGGFVARFVRPGWEGSAGFDYICFECNPLLRPINEGRTRYAFSDFAGHDDPSYGAYWEAMSEADIADAVCATAYGPDRQIASFHIGLPTRDVRPEDRLVLQTASSIVAEKMLAFGPDSGPPESPPELTARECDVMRLVADGKTDWEIGVILGVAESTARFHADNARRKLKAMNRAHAVARFIAAFGLD
ncbi:MAG: LuxR C-terminal-related transcriptional regulator [Sphingomonas sp.]